MPLVFGRKRYSSRRVVPSRAGRKYATRRGGTSSYTSRFAPRSGMKPSRGGLIVRRVKDPRTWFDNSRQHLICMRDFSKQPWANSEEFHLKGCQFFTLSGGIGGIIGSLANIYINDLAHPWGNPSGTDHDPYGVLQLFDRYKVYKVWGCTIKFTFMNSYASTNYLQILPQARDDSYVLGTENYPRTCEKPGIITFFAPEAMASTAVTGNTAGQLPVREATYTVFDLDGINSVQYRADTLNYSAAFGNSPLFRPKITMGVGDWNGNNGSTITVQVECIFHGVAYNRLTQLGS